MPYTSAPGSTVSAPAWLTRDVQRKAKWLPANILSHGLAAAFQQRWDALMARQQKISARRLKRKVGTRQQVIIDEVGPTVSKGRSKADAPQIDGAVYLSSRRPLKVGEIVTAKIERADQYDLHGSVAGF